MGKEGLEKLRTSKVLVLGLGGVGSYVAESLVRSAVGKLTVVDGDVVEISNLNRQLFATTKTVGMPKVQAAKLRLLEINPFLEIEALEFFYSDETSNLINLDDFDYVIDAVDDLKAKVLFVKSAYELNVKVISAMSAGNKLNPFHFEITDIFKTEVCPIARIMRRKLKDLGVLHLKVIYSKEEPAKVNGKLNVIGSVAFVPSVMGLMITSEVVKELLCG